MKIVIAPDSFKGAASSAEIARAIEEGILSVFPGAECILLPAADGGEGTVEAVVAATGGSIRTLTVNDPLFRPVEAQYGIIGDGATAVIEMAAASGLTLLNKNECNPLITTTYGTGELIKDALSSNVKKIIIGIGGSVTNDCGAGMAAALGAVFSDSRGKTFVPAGGMLGKVHAIDLTKRLPEISNIEILAACDVQNPLTGPEGASYVYSAQKGASENGVKILEDNVTAFADTVAKTISADYRNVPGAGAAGGLGFGLLSFLNARLEGGIDIIKSAIDFDRKITGAGLIITGEGKIDCQTAYGKTVAGIAESAQAETVPCIALAGIVDIHPDTLKRIGITEAISISKNENNRESAIKNTLKNIRKTSAEVVKSFLR